MITVALLNELIFFFLGLALVPTLKLVWLWAKMALESWKLKREIEALRKARGLE